MVEIMDEQEPKIDSNDIQVWMNMLNLRMERVTKDQNETIARRLLKHGKAQDLILYLRPFEMEQYLKVLRSRYIGDLSSSTPPKDLQRKIDRANEDSIGEEIPMAAFLNYLVNMSLINIRGEFSFLTGLGVQTEDDSDETAYLLPSIINIESSIWKE